MAAADLPVDDFKSDLFMLAQWGDCPEGTYYVAWAGCIDKESV